MKITFQPKLTKGKYYLFLRINLSLLINDSTLFKTRTAGKMTFTEHQKIKKYKSIYVATGISFKAIEEWDSDVKMFKESGRNSELEHILSLTKEIIQRNKDIVDKFNTGIIAELIKKLVFGRKTKEFKLMINGNSIVDTKRHYNPDQLSKHQERYKAMPRIEGEIENVVEQLHELLPIEKHKQLLLNVPLSRFIESTYKGWIETEKKGKETARTYKNSMSWVERYEKERNTKIKVHNFNQDFVENFFLWAKSQRKKNQDFYTVNFISDIRKQLGVISSELKAIHGIDTKIDWKTSKTLTKSKEKSIDVALNVDQVKQILAYKVPESYVDKKKITRKTPQGKYDALSLIKVGIFTGMRSSDLANLNLVERSGDIYVDQTLQKTGVQVKFLVHPIVREVWLAYNKKLPVLSRQNLSDYFKEIGKDLEWDHNYTYTRRNPGAGKKVIQGGKEFWKMLKSSTLRRTFASMAVNTWKLPLSEVIKITGHSSVGQLMEYVRCDELELNSKLKAKYDEF